MKLGILVFIMTLFAALLAGSFYFQYQLMNENKSLSETVLKLQNEQTNTAQNLKGLDDQLGKLLKRFFYKTLKDNQVRINPIRVSLVSADNAEKVLKMGIVFETKTPEQIETLLLNTPAIHNYFQENYRNAGLEVLKGSAGLHNLVEGLKNFINTEIGQDILSDVHFEIILIQ